MGETITCIERVLKDGSLLYKFKKISTYEDSTFVKNAMEV